MREPRQFNVQQQNARAMRQLRGEAEHWRRHPWPEELALCAQERGVDLSRAIILDLDIDYPGMPHLIGELLTGDERFIRFGIDSGDGRVEVGEWLDITARQNLSEHNQGSGIGRGALAIRLLHELNG